MNANSKSNIRVLVTGAGGFIGSHLTEALINKGYEVVGLLAPGENSPWVKNLNANYVYGDITDKDSLYEKVSDITYVYHLAACSVGHSLDKFYRINYDGTRNLAETCLDVGIKLKRFLFTSSITAIGPSGKKEILDEEVSCNPVSDYGKSKLLAEQFLKSVKERLPLTIVRLPLVYGPRNFGGLYALFKVLNKGFRIDIGKVEANFGFVKDIVDGLILAAESPVATGEIYHLGEDKVYTSNEIWNIVGKALGKSSIQLKIPFRLLYFIALFFESYAKMMGTKAVIRRQDLIEYLKYRYWRVDMSKARREFGFKAKIPLESGAKIVANWYKKEGFL